MQAQGSAWGEAWGAPPTSHALECRSRSSTSVSSHDDCIGPSSMPMLRGSLSPSSMSGSLALTLYASMPYSETSKG